MFGRMLDEGLGKAHFWLGVIGFNLAFFPMHWLGTEGMPRRIYTYFPGQGFEFWNLVATLGSYILGLSVLVFVVNVYLTWRRPRPSRWGITLGGRTLEWATSPRRPTTSRRCRWCTAATRCGRTATRTWPTGRRRPAQRRSRQPPPGC